MSIKKEFDEVASEYVKKNEICDICADKERQSSIIFVVEKAKDISLFEKINIFNGRYHVLGGLISPLEGIGPEDINIDELMPNVVNMNKKTFCKLCKSLKTPIITYCNNVLGMNLE